MSKVLLKSALVAAMGLLACSAQANLVTNGGFETCLGTPANPNPAADKTYFTRCNPSGWTGGSGLIFVDAPGTADGSGYLSVYGAFPATSPTGGNFVESDADRRFNSAFRQVVSGLTAGVTYNLTFWQAAGQQVGFVGDTFEEWEVSFAGTTQTSTRMNTPSGGVTPWNFVSMFFTATSTTETLQFWANGNQGPGSLPPIAFLDGVSLEAPEPASWVLSGLALAALGVSRFRRAARKSA